MSGHRTQYRLTEVATVLLDAAGRVTQWSSGASRLFGPRVEQTLGRDLRDLLGVERDPADPAGADALRHAVAQAARGRRWNGVVAAECGDGRVREVELRLEPMAGDTAPASVVVTAALPSRPDPADSAAGKGLALLHDASARIGTTLDLAATAREIVDVAVPRLADVAGVFALEYLVADDELPTRPADGAIEVRRLAVGVAGGEERRWADAFPVDEIVVFPAHTPYARCLATGTAVLFGAPTADGVAAVRDREVVRRLQGCSSFLAVPLRARGKALGFVAFARDQAAQPFLPQDLDLAEQLATRAAVCIDNARLYRRERRTAVALREGLLPGELTAPPGVRIAHRYLPASEVAPLGGDWYDAVALSGGRVAVVVGDAMGHGSVAAAAMVQLRTAVRTLASLNMPPADVLYRLDTLAQSLAAAQFATCVYVTCDPASRSVVVAQAGHVPPILVGCDGTTTVLDLPPGLPLGVGGAPFHATEFEVPAGGALALYTDGLVERRERDLDTGIADLRAALSSAWADLGRGLDTVCDDVTAALAGRREADDVDDVTLLLVRMPLPAPFPEFSRISDTGRWRAISVNHLTRFAAGILAREKY